MVYKTNPDGTVEFVRGSNVKVTVTKDMNKDVFFEQDYKRIKMMEKCESLNRNNPIIQDGKKLCLICNQYITIGDFGDHLENHRVAINLKLKENGKDVSDIYVCAICGKELDATFKTLKNIKESHSEKCFYNLSSKISLIKRYRNFPFNLIEQNKILIPKKELINYTKCPCCESLCLKSDTFCLFCSEEVKAIIRCKYCSLLMNRKEFNKHIKFCTYQMGLKKNQKDSIVQNVKTKNKKNEKLVTCKYCNCELSRKNLRNHLSYKCPKNLNRIKLVQTKLPEITRQKKDNPYTCSLRDIVIRGKKRSLTPYIEEHSPVENQHLIREQGRFGSMPLYDNMD